jgi:hypothetical protein
MTSLPGVDSYRDLPRYLAEVHDLGRGHPFGFYLKVGFAIPGVMPDAKGPGRGEAAVAHVRARLVKRPPSSPSMRVSRRQTQMPGLARGDGLHFRAACRLLLLSYEEVVRHHA